MTRMFRDLFDDFDDEASDPDTFLDVPFVPTDETVIDTMLELAGVGPSDVLYDLGSGDGRILVAAARDYDTRGIGIEIDTQRIAEAIEYAEDTGVEYLVEFLEDDIFTADIHEASVVTLYLLESVNAQLRPRLLSELRPGTRIVSHAFSMGDWKADERREVDGIGIYKWVVPASVAGVWDWDTADGKYRVELDQKYQVVTGQAWLGDKALQLKSTRLQGNCLTLEIADTENKSFTCFTLNFDDGQLKSVLSDRQQSL